MTSRVDPQDAMTAEKLRRIANDYERLWLYANPAAREGAPVAFANDLNALADELAARSAVVRPTRDSVTDEILLLWPASTRQKGRPFAQRITDNLIAAGFVAVSDSQETPTP